MVLRRVNGERQTFSGQGKRFYLNAGNQIAEFVGIFDFTGELYAAIFAQNRRSLTRFGHISGKHFLQNHRLRQAKQ